MSERSPRTDLGILHVCAKCGKAWPCDLAGLFPHKKKRVAK